MYGTDGFSPHQCISAPKRPTSVLRPFKVIHSFRGKSAPKVVVGFGSTIDWEEEWLCACSSFQVSVDCNRGNKFLLSDGRKSDTISIAQGQGCEDLVQVRRFSKHGKIFVFVAHGLVSLVGAIPTSTGKKWLWTDFRRPFIIRNTSNLLVRVLWHHIWEACSAVLKVSASTAMLRVVAPAPQDGPTKGQMRLLWANTFTMVFKVHLVSLQDILDASLERWWFHGQWCLNGVEHSSCLSKTRSFNFEGLFCPHL